MAAGGLRQGRVRLEPVDGESAENLALGRDDGGRPAGGQAVATGGIAEIAPERVAGDVGGENFPAVEGSTAAGADLGADGDALGRQTPGIGQAGGRAVAEATRVFVEQQDGAAQLGVAGLDVAADVVEHQGKFAPDRDHLQDGIAELEQALLLPPLADIDDAGQDFTVEDHAGYLDRTLAPVLAEQVEIAGADQGVVVRCLGKGDVPAVDGMLPAFPLGADFLPPGGQVRNFLPGVAEIGDEAPVEKNDLAFDVEVGYGQGKVFE